MRQPGETHVGVKQRRDLGDVHPVATLRAGNRFWNSLHRDAGTGAQARVNVAVVAVCGRSAAIEA
jgi:hypothetical protein